MDDVLPLSQPIISEDGEVLHSLPIPKGTKVQASISVYNRHGNKSPFLFLLRFSRLPELFGEDTHSFNPDRWLKDDRGQRGTPIGVYANLYVSLHSFILRRHAGRFTFSGGNKSCLGWRFAYVSHSGVFICLNSFSACWSFKPSLSTSLATLSCLLRYLPRRFIGQTVQ